MKTKYIKIFSLLIILFITSCNDDFLNKEPLDSINDMNFWTTAERLKSATNACYLGLKTKDLINSESLSDNSMWYTSTSTYRIISTGNYSSSESQVKAEWNNAYTNIAKCNYFLDNYEKASCSNEIKKSYSSEVRFIRVFNYMYLTSLFGDVLFIKNAITPEDPILYGKRTEKATIVKWMLQELDSIAPRLPIYYDSKNIGRITRGATLALKSRIALYNNEWEIAEKAAKDVMDLNYYELYSNGNTATSYNEFFTWKGKLSAGKNKETILAYLYLTDVSMHNLSREIQVPDQSARYNPTKSLVDSYLCSDGKPISLSTLYDESSYNNIFENRDPRMSQTILKPGSSWQGKDDGDADNLASSTYNIPKFKLDAYGSTTITGYYFTKYCEPSTVGFVGKDQNDIHLIRYAEVLLNYAEARFEQGKLTQDDLDQTINKLRDRVGMHHMILTEISSWGMNVRDEIRRERRVELALEALRYYDILRWKDGSKLAEDMKGIKKSWFPTDAYIPTTVDANGYIIVESKRTFDELKNYLWPIPFVEWEKNPNLGQNPGWEQTK